MKRIIISDIHIGSKYYKSELLLKFLNEIDYDELILAGDIIDFVKVPLFTSRAIEIFESINYSKPVKYLVGNHDTPLRGFVGHKFFGVEFLEKYDFMDGGRKIRIEHGDSYDNNLVKNNCFLSIISIMHNYLEEYFNVDITTWWTNLNIKKRKLRRVWDILEWNKDADVFIMGHSHCPEAIVWINEDEIIKTYINTGDWVSHNTYVILDNGVARLRKYEPK